MSILWCGGEDIDFPNGTAVTVDTNATRFRAGYARCSLYTFTDSVCRSTPFAGGGVTSCWLSFRVTYGQSGTTPVPIHSIGLGSSGTTKGLFLGVANVSNSLNLALSKWDGTTYTELKAETGSSISTGVIHRIDMQLINYGATATVNAYVDGGLILTYTGDVTLAGVSNFDCVTLASHSVNAGSVFWYLSEIIVADEDTRGFVGLALMAPTGVGTTDQWTGVYSTINGITLSDASPVYTNTVAQDEQFNVTDIPTGTFTIKAVKITARSAVSSPTPTATKISLGYNSGGTVAVGSAFTPTVAFAPLEQINATNPVTGNPFVQSEMNALQINLRSS